MIADQIVEIKTKALRYLSHRRKNGRRQFFSETSTRALIDATSLHIDLAYMLDDLDQHETILLEKLPSLQSSSDGFFHEQGNEYTSGHPRVREMAGTYLGFQVGELLLKLGVPAGEFLFWRFLQDKSQPSLYLDKMPWERSPWGAGGWLDAVATMVRANIAWGYKPYVPVWDHIVAWVLSNQNKDNGLWGKASVQGVEGSFSPEGRAENLRRISEMIRLFLDAGIICLTAFISASACGSGKARKTINCGKFFERICYG